MSNSHSGAIAQWLEQRTHNPLVPGSSPGCPTFFTHSISIRLVEILFKLLAQMSGFHSFRGDHSISPSFWIALRWCLEQI